MILRRVVVVSKQAEVQQLVRKVAVEIFVADDLSECLDIADTIGPDLIIFDGRFSPADIHEFIGKTDKNSADVPVVVVGEKENEADTSAEFMRVGAYDYVQGEDDYAGLEEIAFRIKNESQKNSANVSTGDFFAEDCAAFLSIVGRSKSILKTIKMIKLVAASQCNPVLVVGETGTGKELVARAIHALRHPSEEFVAVNCAALTANLLESELFGHVKGAFTGAEREKTGLLELAGKGTIFFDEISEMPMELQAKLLRVIQEKTFRKVGGVKNIECKATMTASSNRNLKSQVLANRFRRDLYYRLSICPITVAPLRAPERREDIQLLAQYFLKTSTICPEKSEKIKSLTSLALEALNKHDWPGNVRELSNVIERAILLETTDKIGLSSITIESSECGQSPQNPILSHRDQVKDFSLAKAERELIARALQETGWQKTRAAALLGITRATLYAKVKQYNIEKGSCPAKQAQDKSSIPSSLEPVTIS